MFFGLCVGWGTICMLMWISIIVLGLTNPGRFRDLMNPLKFIIACTLVEFTMVALYTTLEIKGLL